MIENSGPQTQSRLYSTLACAGALPFVACALAALAQVEAFPLLGTPLHVSTTYGLVIASFMAGALWGYRIAAREAMPAWLFTTSNVLALTCWFGFLLVSPKAYLLVLSAVFVILLFIDSRLRRAGMLDASYLSVRRGVTLTVLASLGTQFIAT